MMDQLTCFFCLQKQKSEALKTYESDSVSSESAHQPYSLRNIYSYLDSLHRRNDATTENLNDHDHVGLPFCENCLKLTSEFNDLYNLLEETKQKLNCCLQKLQDVMTQNEKDSVFENYSRRKLRTDLRDRIASFSPLPRVVPENLGRKRCHRSRKTKTMNNKRFRSDNHGSKDGNNEEYSCLKLIDHPLNIKIKTESVDDESEDLVDAQPVIKMEICPDIPILEEFDCKQELDGEVTMTTDDMIINGSDEMFQQSRPESTSPLSQFDSRLDCTICSGNQTIDIGPDPVASPSTESFMSDFASCLRPLGEPKIVSTRCTYCGTLNGKSTLMIHLVRFHPEHYFPEERDKALTTLGWTLEQFQQFLKYKLFSRFMNQTAHDTSCTLCHVKYYGNKYNNVFAMQRHLIQKHERDLHEKLDMILQICPEESSDGAKPV